MDVFSCGVVGQDWTVSAVRWENHKTRQNLECWRLLDSSMWISNFSALLIAVSGMHGWEFGCFILVYAELCLQPWLKLPTQQEEAHSPSFEKDPYDWSLWFGLGCEALWKTDHWIWTQNSLCKFARPGSELVLLFLVLSWVWLLGLVCTKRILEVQSTGYSTEPQLLSGRYLFLLRKKI